MILLSLWMLIITLQLLRRCFCHHRCFLSCTKQRSRTGFLFFLVDMVEFWAIWSLLIGCAGGMLTLAALRFILWVSVNDNKKPLYTHSLFAVSLCPPSSRSCTWNVLIVCVVFPDTVWVLTQRLTYISEHAFTSKRKIFISLKGTIMECDFFSWFSLSAHVSARWEWGLFGEVRTLTWCF